MRATASDQRLDAIAGPPAFRTHEPAQGPFPRSPFDGLTIVAVYDATGAGVNSYPNMAYIGGAPADGRVALRFQPTRRIATRFDTLDGANNEVVGIDGGLTAGRHLATVRIPDGLDSLALTLDDASVTRQHTPGSGMTGTGFGADEQAGIWSLVDVCAWPRCLTDEEMLHVSAWLARRYSLSLSLSRADARAHRRLRRSGLGLAA